MIIAHAPIGYLLAYTTQRWWNRSLTKTQQLWVYIVSAVAGAFPDIDLIYFYFIDSQVSHRQLLTHSFVPYLIILLVGALLYRFNKTRYAGVLTLWLAVGAFSHLFADMLIGQADIFAPFNSGLYGLVSFAWYRNSIFMHYSFVTNFLAEFILIALAALTFTPHKRFWLKLGLIGAVVAGVGLVYINNHIYKPSGYYYFSDQDGDGILTTQDRDSDGDGILNINDEDINNDGIDNSTAFYQETFSVKGSLYDYTNGIFIEIPLRLGYVNNTTLVQRMFANVGIFFDTEMTADYSAHPISYTGKPTDSNFSDNPANWKVWLQHTSKLVSPGAKVQEFDVLFFSNGEVALVLSSETNVETVMVADSHSWQTQIIPLTQMESRAGGIVALGRILPKPDSKRY